MGLVTILSDHILALLPQADVVKSISIIAFLLFFASLINQLISTESTLLGVQVSLVLIAILSRMVG